MHLRFRCGQKSMWSATSNEGWMPRTANNNTITTRMHLSRILSAALRKRWQNLSESMLCMLWSPEEEIVRNCAFRRMQWRNSCSTKWTGLWQRWQYIRKCLRIWSGLCKVSVLRTGYCRCLPSIPAERSKEGVNDKAQCAPTQRHRIADERWYHSVPYSPLLLLKLSFLDFSHIFHRPDVINKEKIKFIFGINIVSFCFYLLCCPLNPDVE